MERQKTRLQTERTKKDEGGQPKTVVNKLRPYLAVVVTNLKGVNDAPGRLAEIVCKIGPVKREGPSDVYVIFEKHEDAKKFMQQYIGDTTIFGRSIDVMMKKVFLNIASLA